MKDIELTDTQIALLIKQALEMNANIIASASQIFNQELKPHSQKQVRRHFLDIYETYNKQLLHLIFPGIFLITQIRLDPLGIILLSYLMSMILSSLFFVMVLFMQVFLEKDLKE